LEAAALSAAVGGDKLTNLGSATFACKLCGGLMMWSSIVCLLVSFASPAKQSQLRAG
jgi:hypothetical protein